MPLSRLHILILEDLPFYTDVLKLRLLEDEIEGDLQIVGNKRKFLEFLESQPFDVIISDYIFPDINGKEALALAKQLCPRTPLIIFTGSVDEETAVECMKLGAADYVLKQQPTRLVPALLSAVDKARKEREREEALDLLRKSEAKYKDLVENIHDIYFVSDGNGKFIYGNSNLFKVSGYREQELVFRSYVRLIASADRRRVVSFYLQAASTGQTDAIIEFRARLKDGTLKWVEQTTRIIRDNSGNVQEYRNIVRNVEERKRAQQEVVQSRERLRLLTSRLQSIREEEKTRIAREIHDEFGQVLTAFKLDLMLIDKSLKNLNIQSGAVSFTIQKMTETIDSSLEKVRLIVSDLRPHILDNLGLEEAIGWYGEQFEARTGIQCVVKACDVDGKLDKEKTTALFRILQESLTNVARHSNAKEVDVTMEQVGGAVTLRIKDNGKGITDAQIKDRNSLGILGMKERALILGGELIVEGSQGKGSTVFVRIPLRK